MRRLRRTTIFIKALRTYRIHRGSVRLERGYIYIINGVAIVTGYRPFGNIKADYDICEKYESEANQIIKSVYNYEERKTALDDLISKFIEEVAK